jgi:competence protein ComEC
MAANHDGHLHVYMVSVGQGDTSVIVFPEGKIIVIDAIRPAKLLALLEAIGCDGTVEQLVITHPHSDHFSGANRLAAELTILEATVAPFWHEFGMGPPTYRQLMSRLSDQGTNVTFLSGYGRWYPEGALTTLPNHDPEIDPTKPYLELLGPTNGLVRDLEDADIFTTNHLTLMSRLTWRNFRMVNTGDTQMENWSFFDQERMLEDKCHVLRAAHHGSANGTQWERIQRLNPSLVVVSSDPSAGHELPDLSGAAIFAKFDGENGKMAVITKDTGTIHLRVTDAGTRTLRMFGEAPDGTIDLGSSQVLSEITNPTDWRRLLKQRVQEL